jgi:predicted aminopeptidase
VIFLRIKKSRWLRRWLIGTLLVLIVLVVSGCKTLSFYAQAVRGQYQIFAHEQTIATLVADPRTPEKLKNRLELVRQLRLFADQSLKLPVDGHYRKYVDVHRPYVVWNVEAAPEFSMEPKTWWYPLVGSLKYRGYFSERGATNYGSWLARRGFDVYTGGVEAYSTLGWFKDPLLNTFIYEGDPFLAEIIFHELGHQRVFARGDTDFNEAFATTVGQEGARRWLRQHGTPEALDHYESVLHRNMQFVALVMKTRRQLEALYGDVRDEEGRVRSTKKKRGVPPETLRSTKQQIITGMRQDYARLKAEWGGSKAYDSWFAREINNAKLNSVAAYYDLVPGFEQVLVLHKGDLAQFYDAAERLSKMPKKERHQWLAALVAKKP